MKAQMLKSPAAKLAAAVLLGSASLVLASCFYVPGVSGRAAKAGVSISRALLPANVSSIAVIVGGPGMETIFAQYSVGTTSATLTVPSGVARTFTVLANTPSVTFRDDATVDLQPDETKEIELTPKLFATQIIIPDYYNNQLVQISDMKGTGWTWTYMPSAHDVDYDDQGRIYVAVGGQIAILDDINASPTYIGDSSFIESIAIDRTRSLLYYIESSQLYKVELTPSPGGSEFIMGFESARAVAVDSDGYIYVLSYVSPGMGVQKINPNGVEGAEVIDTSTYEFNYPWDILVNGDFVYVSDQGDAQILQLDKNLTLVDSFSGPASDQFRGPERFVAILNKPITVIDEDSSTGGGDRLVSFGDMTGAGWTIYGASGGGSGMTGLFQFYSNGY